MTARPRLPGMLFAQGDPDRSRVAVYGMPFDATASFRPGSRFGPQAIREASYGLETFSVAQGQELATDLVWDALDLELPAGGVKAALAGIEGWVDEVLERGLIPFGLGGEHLVSLAPIRALAKRQADFWVIQFDAHPDLRESYQGEKLSHATVMRRVLDILGPGRVLQFGLRSGEKDEWPLTHRLPMSPAGVAMAREIIQDAPCYLSLDIDGFDPAYAPGTGTPEPGGFTWQEWEATLPELAQIHWLGMDLVEVAPGLDPSGITAVLAAKAVRELLVILTRQETDAG